MNIVYKGTPNKQLRTGKLKFIVIHWFGLGTLESANTRFQNAANQVSAHYGIDGDRVWQWARENEVAYHCGNLQCNKDSVGIEHNATTTSDASDATYRSSIELITEICKRHGITPSSDTIKPHKAFKATQCPGTLDISRIIDGVRAKLNNAKEDYMKFPLYKDKRNGKIYYKLFNLAGPVVQYIGSPTDLTTYWGSNAPIQDVDSIDQIGVDIAIIDRDNNTRAEQIKQLEAAVETLKGKVNSLQTDVTNLRGDLKARTAELDACRLNANSDTLDKFSAGELFAHWLRKVFGGK